ncbi:MMPL family transporter [Streptomyces sp. NPDC002812]|uniref:MMPL family transporter n=1 Tax=unclassified Streptomyces TaxID=2593676 RepID=UPI00202F6DCE|nr:MULTISPECIES: MMPL family transporter [unclassified Streptomyces]MCM1975134.1 MMPL family transporter [Streptomyces sp. G1]MCX5122735.1 MMPL family transporter [Streptomyces sp. NBC_00347]MCX5296090.1 MMPL family transporter [Streptomyces sp. NBC_00193]
MMRKIAALPSGRLGKWVVIALWAALLVPALMLAGKLGDVEENDNSAWLPGNAESTAVVERAEKFMSADTIPAVVIYDRSAGVTEADLAKAKADVEAFNGIENIVGPAQGPVKSDDGKAIQTVVQVKKDKSGWEGIGTVVDAMTEVGKKNADGLGFHVAGPSGYAADSIKAFSGGGALTTITALVVVAILLLTYRSPLLPLLPLLTVGVALVTSEAVIYVLAKNAGLVVNKQTSFILTVLVFGAATDYALLLISRYREELLRHEDRHDAMAEALYRSSPAIIASAATVAVSLMLLMLATLNSTQGLGPACAVGVLVGLLAMITLMPALLVACGRWIFWPVKPTYGAPATAESGIWARVGTAVSGRPRLVWIGTALALAVMALGVLGLKADGLANKDQFTNTPQMAVGEQIRSEHFPAGSGDPIFVVSKAASAEQVRTALLGVPGIASVTPPTAKDGEAVMLGELEDDPSSTSAMGTVKDARDAVHAVEGADAQVGGSSAVMLDTQTAAARDSKVIIPIVLVVVLLILMLLLRSVVAPVLLMGTVVLSFGAAIGVSSLVFNHVFGFAGAEASFPLLTFVFLVALGIDYNIFLVTRVREVSVEQGTRRGALLGLSTTGGVITSAGLVLAGTFGAMASLPLVFAAELGFAVAFGVLLDTMIVRSVLVTALTLDVGRWMWWPSKLFLREDDSEPLVETPDLEPALGGK